MSCIKCIFLLKTYCIPKSGRKRRSLTNDEKVGRCIQVEQETTVTPASTITEYTTATTESYCASYENVCESYQEVCQGFTQGQATLP